jgi:hypothetical protein
VSEAQLIVDARTTLRSIVQDLNLPSTLAAEIDALDERSPQSIVSNIVDKLMMEGLATPCGALSPEQLLFGLNLVRCFVLDPMSPAQKLIECLIDDLHELKVGVVPPAFRPASTKGRARDNAVLRVAKMASAAMCHALISTGLNANRAADKVAKALNKQKVRLQASDVGAKAVLQWRRTFRRSDGFERFATTWERDARDSREKGVREFEYWLGNLKADRAFIASLPGKCDE